MKQFVVLIMLLCIAVLPVSGQPLAHASEHSAEHLSAITEAADHCPLHAAESNERVHAADSPEKEIGQLHDCCDGTQMCSSGECPADCGHCKAPGHGHCATLSGNSQQSEQHESGQWLIPAGYHSRTISQPTPPPNYSL